MIEVPLRPAIPTSRERSSPPPPPWTLDVEKPKMNGIEFLKS
jgi:hypothetical protein